MSKSQLKRFLAQGAAVATKCIGCGQRQEIKPGEVKAGDVPLCPKCYMPMIAEGASRKS